MFLLWFGWLVSWYRHICTSIICICIQHSRYEDAKLNESIEARPLLHTSSMVSRATGSGWSMRSMSACTSSNAGGTSTLRILFQWLWF